MASAGGWGGKQRRGTAVHANDCGCLRRSTASVRHPCILAALPVQAARISHAMRPSVQLSCC